MTATRELRRQLDDLWRQVEDLNTTESIAGGGIATGAITIDVSSTTALLVEDDGTQDNALVVDTSNGRVGIGTGSPDRRLHVHEDTQAVVVEVEGDNSTGALIDVIPSVGSYSAVRFSDGSTIKQIVGYDVSNDQVFIGSGLGSGQQLVVENSNGRVGIGTSSPSSLLQVAGQVRIEGGTDRLTLPNSGSSNMWNFDNNSGTLRIFRDNYSSSGTGSGGAVRMVIKDGGNVGIGTTSPAVELHVSQSGDAANLVLERTGANDDDFLGAIDFYEDGTNFAEITAQAKDVTGSTEDAKLLFFTRRGGSFTSKMDIADGVVVGSPTGGDKGIGTLNAKAVYDDNTLLTDYVFESDYDLMPISDMRDFYRTHKHLPTIPGRDEWDRRGGFSLGELVTDIWETVEVQARYIAQLEERITQLEGPPS